MKVNIKKRYGKLQLDLSIPDGRIRYALDEEIGKLKWNKNKQRFAGNHEINDYLDQICAKIQDIRRQLILDSKLTVKDFTYRLDMLFGKEVNATTLSEYLTVIRDRKEKDKGLNPKYLHSFNMTIKQVLQAGDIELDRINKKWIEHWKTTGYESGYAVSSMMLSYRLIKMTLKAAYEEGMMKQTYTHVRTTFPRSVIINPYNTPDELDMIENADLIGKLDLVRDIYLIGCETGQRPNIYLKLDHRYIQSDYIQVVQQKTGIPIKIPLNDRLSRLLEGVAEKKKVNRKLLGKSETAYYQNFLFYLPRVCRIAGITTPFIKKGIEYQKCDLIKPHTARRTYTCIRYYHHKEQPMNIMKVTGHQSLQTFERYVQASA